MPANVVTARDVLSALAVRHAKDIFVTECKDGATQDGYARMDAWAMERSWANPRIVAYEVKVSRQDFLRDVKWQNYLPHCNELYFAAPKGLIQTCELPEGVGLVELIGAGKVYTRRKAPWRNVPPPVGVMKYILMSRARITGAGEAEDAADYWRAWLAKKAEDREIGYRVRRELRTRLQDLERENQRLRRENENLSGVRRELESLGLHPGAYSWEVRNRLKAARDIVPPEVVATLSACINQLSGTLEKVRRWRERVEAEAALQNVQQNGYDGDEEGDTCRSPETSSTTSG